MNLEKSPAEYVLEYIQAAFKWIRFNPGEFIVYSVMAMMVMVVIMVMGLSIRKMSLTERINEGKEVALYCSSLDDPSKTMVRINEKIVGRTTVGFATEKRIYKNEHCDVVSL